MEERRRRSVDDGAVSDFVSTILLVALVVSVGAVFSVVVASSLSTTPIPAASFALMGLNAGDDEAEVVLRQGESVSLAELRITLERADATTEIPPSNWTTPDADVLRAGDTLRFALDPPVAADERLRVKIVHKSANLLLADLATAAGAPTMLLPAPTVQAGISPLVLPADGTSAARLTLRVSHPAGALAIGSIVADTSSIAAASGSAMATLALRDDGQGGDLVGGDGVWSTLVALPTTTPEGSYPIVLHVIDAAGRSAGNATVHLQATPVVAIAAAPSTGESGALAGSGAAFSGPTSENVTQLRLRNWTWDKLYPQRVRDDVVTLRIAGGGESWNVRITLTESGGTAHATGLLVWTGTHETSYRPLNGTLLPLANLDMDLLDPVGSLQWVRHSGAANPLALYQNANITVRPTFVVPYFGHDVTTGNQQTSIETGIISVEVVFV